MGNKNMGFNFSTFICFQCIYSCIIIILLQYYIIILVAFSSSASHVHVQNEVHPSDCFFKKQKLPQRQYERLEGAQLETKGAQMDWKGGSLGRQGGTLRTAR